MANIDAGLVRGPQGPQGIKGDPFTYADFTESQIAELQRPAAEAAILADKATKDAQAAIAEVKATEAKLYPAAENVLKGKVNETFIHVDDAFPSSLLGIEVEGACRQDGTPSPDNPVPIEVIEHPVLQLTGKNLLKYPFAFSHANQETISGITFTDNGDGSISMEGTSTRVAFYNLDFTSNAKQLIGKTISIQDIANKDINFAVGFFFEDGSYATVLTTKGDILKAKVPEKVTLQRIYIGVSVGATVNETIRPFIYFKDDDEFTEYTSQSQAFTLPAEHPYLAKLPDGTADEIRVDREGNVELVARVGKTDNTTPFTELYEEKANGADFQVAMEAHAVFSVNTSMSPFCRPGDVNMADPVMGGIVKGDYVRMTRPEKVTNFESAKAYLKELGFEMWFLGTEKTYQLGKIEMPKAQDSIVNVWTDAEVTPQTGIEYTRDVNIVVANLESAIASITQG